jgi:hypothetical protein
LVRLQSSSSPFTSEATRQRSRMTSNARVSSKSLALRPMIGLQSPGILLRSF